MRTTRDDRHDERLWSTSFLLMSAGSLLLFVAFYMLYPTLPLYIQRLGGDETQVGLAMGLFMLSAVVLRPVVGGLLDRFGRRPFILWGLLLFAGAMVLYDWVGGIVVLLGLRVLHGLSWAVSSTAIMTAVTDMLPPARRGEGLGWFGMAMTLAMAVGPLLGLWIAQDVSYSALFLVAAVLSCAALLASAGARMPFEPRRGGWNVVGVDRSVLPVAISVFFLFLSYGGVTTFVPLFAAALEVNSGLFFLAYAASLALVRPVAGRLSDRHGEAFVMVPALLIAIAALIVLSLATGLYGVIASAVLYGVGFGSAQPVLHALTIRLVPPDRRGAANASFTTAVDLGIGLGAVALGWVSRATSYQGLFVVTAVSVAIALLVFALTVRPLVSGGGRARSDTRTSREVTDSQ